MNADLTSELEQLLNTNIQGVSPLPPGEFVIYGAGNRGAAVTRKLAEAGRSVVAFLDAYSNGGIYESMPVVSPSSSDATNLAKEDFPVIIAVFNCAADLLSIVNTLKEIGFSRVISYYEFHEALALPSLYWLGSRDVYELNHQQIRDVWRILNDDVSRQIFLDSLRLRLTFDLRLLRSPDRATQYLPPDLPLARRPLRFIDAGAYTGDTIASLLTQGIDFEAVAAFEPDPDNFRALGRSIHENTKRLGDVTLWPCGVSGETTTARFHSGQQGASVVASKGETSVQLIALDEVLPCYSPNYIKMDIEGAELSALDGAAEMIRRFQPDLAICAYHTPEHLWQIPQKMHELLPSHRIALRYHGFNGFDLVAYAFLDTAETNGATR